MQAAIATISAAIAFAPSLVWLPRDLPRGLLSVMPVLGLLLVIGMAIRPPAREPEIHDRYLDYILGGVLLGTAIGSLLFLPQSLSIFFWSWRLDIVVLVLFVAGAIAILCGSRALWRYRIPLALLVLAWPVPVLIPSPHLWGEGQGEGALPIGLIALVPLAWLLVKAFDRRVRSAPQQSRAGGGLIAAVVVLAGAGIIASADGSVAGVGAVLNPDGTPLVVAMQSPQVVGAFRQTTPSGQQAFPSWGLQGPLSVYGDPTIALNLFLPANHRDLSLPPTTVAERQGYVLLVDDRIDLGDGVFGRFNRYAAPDGQDLLVVWWDWPVQSTSQHGRATARERVIAEEMVSKGASANQLDAFARGYVVSAASPLVAS